ncbi:hypothetical protein [Sodalis-like endosymbiont of Proechinophthirus fluctus]|nr:hypothetical protein [Sodalis-like endosymbiont of Proechinophthirus fluctus]
MLAVYRQTRDVTRLAAEDFEALALDLDDLQGVEAVVDEVFQLTSS